MNKSVTLKKALGTFRHDRDKEIYIPGQYIDRIKIPKGIRKDTKLFWKITVPPILSLKLIQQQDIVILHQAFHILDDALRIREMKNNMQITEDPQTYIMLSRQESKLIEKFEQILRRFYVTPKERFRIFSYLQELQQKQKEKDTIDELILS
ncbi:TPA: hypothetical protein ENX78_08570 [Candidatus Poribacteria bacterium]|nr:hypothetical protein [Candidatus Poribacteria bacterium]